MNNFEFSKKSLEKLSTVDLKLQELAKEVLKESPYDFLVICGIRTTEEQKELFLRKASKCDGVKNKSKHQLGKAIDILIYKDAEHKTFQEEYYREVAKVFKEVAERLNIKIRWGGDFKGFFDGMHFELME